MSLADAREKREAARKLPANGKDPSTERRLERLASETAARNTVGLIAAQDVKNLEDGGMAEITAAEILDLLKRGEKSGRRETARLRRVIGGVFRPAM